MGLWFSVFTLLSTLYFGHLNKARKKNPPTLWVTSYLHTRCELRVPTSQLAVGYQVVASVSFVSLRSHHDCVVCGCQQLPECTGLRCRGAADRAAAAARGATSCGPSPTWSPLTVDVSALLPQDGWTAPAGGRRGAQLAGDDAPCWRNRVHDEWMNTVYLAGRWKVCNNFSSGIQHLHYLITIIQLVTCNLLPYLTQPSVKIKQKQLTRSVCVFHSEYACCSTYCEHPKTTQFYKKLKKLVCRSDKLNLAESDYKNQNQLFQKQRECCWFNFYSWVTSPLRDQLLPWWAGTWPYALWMADRPLSSPVRLAMFYTVLSSGQSFCSKATWLCNTIKG